MAHRHLRRGGISGLVNMHRKLIETALAISSSPTVLFHPCVRGNPDSPLMISADGRASGLAPAERGR